MKLKASGRWVYKVTGSQYLAGSGLWSDLGMIREHARVLANFALGDGEQDGDPMERVDLDAATLTRNPGLLHDEQPSLCSPTLTVKAVVVMVRTSGDQIAQIIKDYLTDPSQGARNY